MSGSSYCPSQYSAGGHKNIGTAWLLQHIQFICITNYARFTIVCCSHKLCGNTCLHKLCGNSIFVRNNFHKILSANIGLCRSLTKTIFQNWTFSSDWKAKTTEDMRIQLSLTGPIKGPARYFHQASKRLETNKSS